jgi:hypothetical protein
MTDQQYRAEIDRLSTLVLELKVERDKLKDTKDALENDLINANMNLEHMTAEVDRLNEKQRWIPVDEKFPAMPGAYLVRITRSAPEYLGGNETFTRIKRLNGDTWQLGRHIPEWINLEIDDTVTHWMPLPQPPEKEKA